MYKAISNCPLAVDLTLFHISKQTHLECVCIHVRKSRSIVYVCSTICHSGTLYIIAYYYDIIYTDVMSTNSPIYEENYYDKVGMDKLLSDPVAHWATIVLSVGQPQFVVSRKNQVLTCITQFIFWLSRSTGQPN